MAQHLRPAPANREILITITAARNGMAQIDLSCDLDELLAAGERGDVDQVQATAILMIGTIRRLAARAAAKARAH